jgi:hypothetical protein
MLAVQAIKNDPKLSIRRAALIYTCEQLGEQLAAVGQWSD